LSNEDELRDDILWGAAAIGDYLGKNYRQTVYLLSTKRLPAKKLGAMWIAQRSKLRACLLDEEVA
jgi:hypothetical protein